MEIKNICISYDIDRSCPPKRASVTHVNDVNTRIIELTLKQGDDKLSLDSGCTASASIVERVTKKLIASEIECEISESGSILIPVDNLHFRDKMDINIEVSVSDSSDGQVLTLPYPIWIRVNPSVLDEAEVSDKSLGTVPELIKDAKELVENYHYELTEDDVERIAAEVDVAGKEDASNKKTSIGNQSQEGDSDTNYPTVGAVRDFVNLVKSDLEDYVDDEIGSIPGVTVDSGFSQTSTNPVQNKVVTAKFNEVDSKIAAIPTVTVDSDFSLASTNPVQNKIVAAKFNEIIAGKADKANSLSGYGITNAYNKTEVDYALAHKADKSTTLAGYGITDAYTKSEVDALVSDSVIPQYVIDESESVLAKAFAHKGLGRTIRFIAVSDSHNDAAKASHDYTRVSNMHCGQAVKYIAERIPLDFVASLGDMTWAGVAHTTEQYQTDWLKADIQEMNMFLKDGFSGVPNIRVVGNHDQCTTTDSGGTVSRLQNSGAYQYFGRYNAGANDGLSNYGYYDIENVRLRVIYLNTSDTVSTTSQGTLLNVSQEQKNWLCETLIDVNSKSNAADWKILLLSHAPLDMVSGIAADILIPYTNGGTYGSYTFTNHNAKIIGNCHGHTHCYRVDYMADKIRRFTIPNSNFYDNNHYKDNANYSAWNEDTTYPKTANSRTDTSFSLVTVDLDSLTCYVDNYGAGYDREFSLDYKSAPAPVNLFDKNDSDVVLRARFNSSHVPVAYADGQLVTGFIPVSNSDTITIAGDKSQNTNPYVGYVNLYNSNKEYIGAYASPGLNGQKIVWSSDYLEGSLDCSQAPDAGTNSGAAYIRFCLAYTNIDNLVITK